MLRAIDNYFLHHNEPTKSCLMALREIILGFDKDITETWKYHMPVYCYKGKMFCYLWTDKKTNEPYMGIVEGKRIEHPQLEQGSRSRMKIFRIDPARDLPHVDIQFILEKALDLYKTGVIKIKAK